jgi:hypothetical protein
VTCGGDTARAFEPRGQKSIEFLWTFPMAHLSAPTATIASPRPCHTPTTSHGLPDPMAHNECIV